MPIKTLTSRLPRLGRISLGYSVPGRSKKDGRVVRIPKKSDTIVFSANSRARLDQLVEIYGGTVRQVVAGPDGDERFALISKATEIQVMLPSDDETLVFSEWLELHGQSGLKRRCDGETVQLLRDVDPDTGELLEATDVPCLCEARGLSGEEACRPTLRLNLVLPDALDIEGIGVWSATSSGWRSCARVKEFLQLLHVMFGRVAGMPLLLGIGTAKGEKGSYRHFTLNSPLTMREALAAAARGREGLMAALAPAALPAPEDTTGHEPHDDDPEDVEEIEDPDGNADLWGEDAGRDPVAETGRAGRIRVATAAAFPGPVSAARFLDERLRRAGVTALEDMSDAQLLELEAELEALRARRGGQEELLDHA